MIKDMITEDYCSFEISKLLKEKGFEQHKCQHSYDSKGMFKWSDVLDPYECSAPTHQMVMKWLREVYDIFIDIGYDDLDWYWLIESISKDIPYEDRPKLIKNGTACHKTYEEAVEAALKYALTNLI